jgi:hypothetical protein
MLRSRVNRLALIPLTALLAAAACTPRPAPPAPAPAPAPAPSPTPAPAPRPDTSAAPRDTLAAVRPRPAVPDVPPAPPRVGADRTAVRMARVAGVVRVCAGGDVTLGTDLGSRVYRRDPDALLAPLAPLFTDADLVLLNVEGAIGDGPAPTKCGKGSTACYAMRMPPSAAGALRRVAPTATVVGNLANNHARDAGASGFAETGRRLRAASVRVTGADTLPTVVVTPAGDTVAVLGFGTSPGGPDLRDLAAVRRHVRRAAERHERVVVTMHLGAEGVGAQRTRRGSERFHGADRGDPVAFARAAVESGADLVVGHGPHVMRAAEWQRDEQALVLYSLGNLLTYGPFSMREPLNRGAVACAALEPDGAVSQAMLRSTVQRGAGQLEIDGELRAAQLVDSLGRLDFPRTGARVGPDGVLTKRAARPVTGERRD